MNREYHRWFSPHLGRDMELLVFGHAGTRTLVFPTRDGRFYDYENWGLVQALESRINAGCLQLFCVDSVDAESLYCFWCRPADRMVRHQQYEAYLLNEVLPLTCRKNPNPLLTAHGCSLGAYHAVNIAFRHPDLFGKVVALSGRYDLTGSVGNFRGLFDGYYDQNIYYNTPCHFIPLLTDPVILDQLRRMEIILVIGEDDPFLENNYQLSDALQKKQIKHALHVWSGEAHRARYWRQMVSLYL
jgi:esterase/lipase superfamily enzyme